MDTCKVAEALVEINWDIVYRTVFLLLLGVAIMALGPGYAKKISIPVAEETDPEIEEDTVVRESDSDCSFKEL